MTATTSRAVAGMPAGLSFVTAPEAVGRSGWQWALYAFVLVLAAVHGLFQWWTPFQMSDHLGNILQVDHATWQQLFDGFIPQPDANYYRPMLWIAIKALWTVADGENYLAVFRGLSIAETGLLLLLLARLMPVRSAGGFVAGALALALVVAHPGWIGMVSEGFPINHFLTAVLACVAVANLSASRGGILPALAAVFLLVFTTLMIETGLLITVVATMAFVAGFRGLSWRTLGVLWALTIGYVAVRVSYGAAGLEGVQITSGYWQAFLEPNDVRARFTDTPLVWYRYNVLSSILGVLFTEPDAGYFRAVKAYQAGNLSLSIATQVAVFAAATLSIVVYSVPRLFRWVRLRILPEERWAFAFPFVLVANAVFCFAYIKSVILMVAVVFMALALFAALERLTARAQRSTIAAGAVAIGLFVGSTALAAETGTTFYRLYEDGKKVQREWVLTPATLDRQGIMVVTDRDREIVDLIQRQSLGIPGRVLGTFPKWFRDYAGQQ